MNSVLRTACIVAAKVLKIDTKLSTLLDTT